jgi:hypothetical protein
VIYEDDCIPLLANGLLQRKTGRHDHRSVSFCSTPVSGHCLDVFLQGFTCLVFLKKYSSLFSQITVARRKMNISNAVMIKYLFT